jgi:hypothetical protein
MKTLNKIWIRRVWSVDRVMGTAKRSGGLGDVYIDISDVKKEYKFLAF